jgi:hypothetical protein
MRLQMCCVLQKSLDEDVGDEKKSDHFYCTKKSAKKSEHVRFLHTISSTKKIVRNVLSLSAVG